MRVRPEITVLLQPYGAVYIEIPKVACTSLKVAFAELLGVALDGFGGDPHQAQFPSIACRSDAHGPLFPDLFAFAFVRNPWDRLVSCYRDKIAGEVDGFTRFDIRPGVADCLAGFAEFTAGMSFEEFAMAVASIPDTEADAHFRSQHTFVTNEAGAIAIDFVGRYESLHRDLEYVQRRTGLPNIRLPRLQASRGRVRYRDYYTTRTRDAVAERFRDDIELFAYAYAYAFAMR
jgi:chondroitin 4-sulfotransferase 11